MNQDDLIAAERRRRVAEALMAQGQEPINANRVAGGYVVPVQPLEGIAKIAQQLTGAYLGKKADEKLAGLRQQELDQIRNLDLNDPNAANQLLGMGRISEALSMQRMSNEQTRPNYYQPTNIVIQDPETKQLHLRRYGSDSSVAPITDTASIPQNMRWLDTGGQYESVPTKGSFAPPSVQTQPQPQQQNQRVTYNDVLSWLPSQMMVESGGDPNAVSNKGAQGLAQIMPETAQNPGYGMPTIDLANTTPQQQALWAAQYQYRIAQAHPDWTKEQVISSYNMGPGNTEKGLINNDYVNKVTGGIKKTLTPAQAMENDPKVQAKIAGAEEAAKQAAKVKAEKELTPIKADTEKQKALAKEQASFMATYPDRMRALEQTEYILNDALDALGATLDEKGNPTSFAINTGGYNPKGQEFFYQNIVNDPARRKLEMANAVKQLNAAVEYLKGQGQVTEGERAIVALLAGIDPYKYDSATNYKNLMRAKNLLAKEMESYRRRAEGDFSTEGYSPNANPKTKDSGGQGMQDKRREELRKKYGISQ